VLVQIGENFATLTPFGSLTRISPAKVSSGKAWRVCFFARSGTPTSVRKHVVFDARPENI
jgi:hypothetical protein